MYFPQSANTANLLRGLKTTCEEQKKTIVFLVLKALRKVHKQLEYSSFYRQKAPREIHKKFELGIVFSKPLGLEGRGVIKIFFFFPLLATFVKSADRLDGISIENATL